ncbi:MAG: dioxygenase [Gammaproteobacteria bacterium]|nr:dioxygenase [Gammaproteobacteria bacterium]
MTHSTLFVSHGAPTFAAEPGRAGPLLQTLGRELGDVKAVLIVSPHWMTRDVTVMTTPMPSTIHDFGGFPAPLYQLRYDAPGHPALAQKVGELLAAGGHSVSYDNKRGRDHGAWVPLMYLFPEENVPVFQISLPISLDGPGAYQLGQTLRPLVRDGVLVIGSGSLTHNLYELRAGAADSAPYAIEFAHWIRQQVVANDVDALTHALDRAPHAQRTHPTSEHYLPLLIALGAAESTTPATVIDGGFTYGVLSMESYAWGSTTEGHAS